MPTYTYQQAVGMVDTHIRSDGVDTAYYTQTSAGIGESNGAVGRIYRYLSYVPLTGISSSETVTSATLYLKRNADQADNAPTIQVFPVLKDWHSQTQATWNSQLTGTAWQTAGCDGSADRGQTAIGEITLTATEGANVEWAISLDTATIQGWVGTPTSNHGLLLKTVDELNDCYLVYSNDYDVVGGRNPRYVIETTASAGGLAKQYEFYARLRNG